MHPQLLRKLSKPSKVASILDWKKSFDNTVLSLNFHKNRVGIAVASHPSLGIPCIELEPLRFDSNNGNRKNIAGSIDRHCLERFSDIIEGYKVCTICCMYVHIYTCIIYTQCASPPPIPDFYYVCNRSLISPFIIDALYCIILYYVILYCRCVALS